MTDRLARLQSDLELPLIVTQPTNIRYLCGFESSNAALIVERERVRLYTDFRYIESAQDVRGYEMPAERSFDIDTPRDLALAELLFERR